MTQVIQYSVFDAFKRYNVQEVVAIPKALCNIRTSVRAKPREIIRPLIETIMEFNRLNVVYHVPHLTYGRGPEAIQKLHNGLYMALYRAGVSETLVKTKGTHTHGICWLWRVDQDKYAALSPTIELKKTIRSLENRTYALT